LILFRINVFYTFYLGNRRCVFDLKANEIESLPDGMTIDVEGNLWLATYRGRKILRIDPRTQALLDSVELPCLNITSCTWGGDGYDVLYVTTAARGSDLELDPLGGSLFKVICE
jgi:sugar lactone lactonase YvrE